MIKYLLLLMFLYFLNENLVESTSTLSPIDQEISKIRGEVEFMNDAVGALIYKLAVESDTHKKELAVERDTHKKELAVERDTHKKELAAKDQTIGGLLVEKEIFSKMLQLLGARSRVETLADDLYPEKRPNHVGVIEAFEEILTSSKPEFLNRGCIIVFRQRISDYGLPTTDFLDAIRSIYGCWSSKAAHKMERFDPLPPKYDDIRGIKEMYESYGITPDEAKVKAAQIILEPLPLLTTKAH